MDNSNSIMQQRRSSIKLYTEFSQNYPAVHNLPIQIDNSSHSIRSIIIPSMIMQSTGIQTMNMTPEVSVQVDLLTQQSEFTQTDLEVDNNVNNNPPILLDATTDSSINIENSTDSLRNVNSYSIDRSQVIIEIRYINSRFIISVELAVFVKNLISTVMLSEMSDLISSTTLISMNR
uniref:Uncharacterized protein n=1 Tax=Schistosoma haematobium TaxID=6185 RepID=A0A095BVE3_SCHHA